MAHDLIVTVHALQRFDLRFPEEGAVLGDYDLGLFMSEEIAQAYEAGRHAKVPPLELANRRLARAMARGKGEFVWTRDKRRGYVVCYQRNGDLLVLTVVNGTDLVNGRKKLYLSQH